MQAGMEHVLLITKHVVHISMNSTFTTEQTVICLERRIPLTYMEDAVFFLFFISLEKALRYRTLRITTHWPYGNKGVMYIYNNIPAAPAGLTVAAYKNTTEPRIPTGYVEDISSVISL